MSIKQWVVRLRPTILALLLAGIWSCTLPRSSFAACTNDPGAAENALNFVNNPSSLLSRANGPLTPSEITGAVRDFVAANPQALAAVIALLKGGGLSADQQKAIGTGLGLAAGICIRPDPTFAAEIQTQIAGTDSSDAKQAYASVTGNQLIGTVGGGAGGGGGGSAGSVGGQTNPFASPSGSSAFQPFTSNSVSNTPTNYFGGSVGGISNTIITTTNTVTTNTVVCVVSKNC
jgi:hypothetical protein